MFEQKSRVGLVLWVLLLLSTNVSLGEKYICPMTGRVLDNPRVTELGGMGHREIADLIKKEEVNFLVFDVMNSNRTIVGDDGWKPEDREQLKTLFKEIFYAKNKSFLAMTFPIGARDMQGYPCPRNDRPTIIFTINPSGVDYRKPLLHERVHALDKRAGSALTKDNYAYDDYLQLRSSEWQVYGDQARRYDSHSALILETDLERFKKVKRSGFEVQLITLVRRIRKVEAELFAYGFTIVNAKELNLSTNDVKDDVEAIKSIKTSLEKEIAKSKHQLDIAKSTFGLVHDSVRSGSNAIKSESVEADRQEVLEGYLKKASLVLDKTESFLRSDLVKRSSAGIPKGITLVDFDYNGILYVDGVRERQIKVQNDGVNWTFNHVKIVIGDKKREFMLRCPPGVTVVSISQKDIDKATTKLEDGLFEKAINLPNIKANEVLVQDSVVEDAPIHDENCKLEHEFSLRVTRGICNVTRASLLNGRSNSYRGKLLHESQYHPTKTSYGEYEITYDGVVFKVKGVQAEEDENVILWSTQQDLESWSSVINRHLDK